MASSTAAGSAGSAGSAGTGGGGGGGGKEDSVGHRVLEQLRHPFGSLWRSEDMVLVQLVMHSDAVYRTVQSLGELEVAQFLDFNSDHKRSHYKFASEIALCTELERRLRLFESHLRRAAIPIEHSDRNMAMHDTVPFDTLATDLEALEKDISDISNSHTDLIANYRQVEDLLHIIQLVQTHHMEETVTTIESTHPHVVPLPPPPPQTDIPSDGSTSAAPANDTQLPVVVPHTVAKESKLERKCTLDFVAGTVPLGKWNLFRLLVFRVTRGNTLINSVQFDVVDPLTDTKTNQVAFTMIFPSEKVHTQIIRMCAAADGKIYEHYIPEHDSIDAVEARLTAQKAELFKTISTAKNQYKTLLTKIAKQFSFWATKILVEKSTLHTFHLLKWEQTTVLGRFWCRKSRLPEIDLKIKEASISSGSRVESFYEIIPSTMQPPTFYDTNSFTAGFHSLVESYGVARYHEINPAIFSIATFPFLFSVMFGDIGHGIMLALFALVLIIFQKKIARLNSDIILLIFSGRYVLLLMGLFSIFTGILYNEWFSLPLEVCGGSAFEFTGNDSSIATKLGHTYPCGMDPAWYRTENRLLYTNSLKMKISVIFGVIHMSLGLFIALFNHIHFRHWIEVLFEFIPEFVFLMCTFGYMDFLIFLKWLSPGNEASILQTTVNFFLSPNPFELPKGVDPLYPGQAVVQFVLLVVALLMIPLLLIPKPIIEFVHHKIKYRRRLHLREKPNDAIIAAPIELPQQFPKISTSPPDSDQHPPATDSNSQPDPAPVAHVDDIVISVNPTGMSLPSQVAQSPAEIVHHSSDLQRISLEHRMSQNELRQIPPQLQFSDLVVSQLIHTIEYVLGVVSNTASYLRLWALSLAHSQLAEVFWDMFMMGILDIGGLPGRILDITGFGVFVAFSGWLAATIAVLLMMECLSAFLHALRLHWVEFQNKFYYGDGTKFEPFSYRKILTSNIDSMLEPLS